MSDESQDFIRALFGQPPEPEPQAVEPEGPPDFDGGAREPAPGPSDPAAEHNQLLIELLGGQA